ncbi:MAG: DHHA1 domain-containing protein [Dysosmobacter welbionis]
MVGIVASRLSEKYACPSFMIHLKDGVGKGSCRSYGGFNLFSALESCADLLEGFGGHELAAGFTISEENIDAFRARMNRYVRSASGGERAVSCLDVDAPISCPGEVTLAEVEQLDQLEPYGAGNPRPVFALLGATVDVLQPVGQGKHLKLRLSKGTCRFDAIFFSMTEETCGVAAGMRVDAAFISRPIPSGAIPPCSCSSSTSAPSDPQPVRRRTWTCSTASWRERASPGRSGPGSRRPAASSPPLGPCWSGSSAGERRRRRCCPFCGGCRHSPAGVRASSGPAWPWPCSRSGA